MTISSVKHPFTSAKADGPDATLIQPGDWNAVHTLFEIPQPYVVGFNGENNAATPNTQFDLTSARVIVARDSSGNVYGKWNQGSLTCNLATAGPAANARDTSGALGTTDFVHFYYIYNPTTDTWASTASATAPPTGPALPSGYTAWTYVCSVWNAVGPALRTVYVRGSWVYHRGEVAALSAGTATSTTAITITAIVPSIALAYNLSGFHVVRSAADSATTTSNVRIEVVSGTTFASQDGSVNYPAAVRDHNSPLAFAGVPNVGQVLRYYSSVAGTGSTQGVTLNVTGYKVPNGDS